MARVTFFCICLHVFIVLGRNTEVWVITRPSFYWSTPSRLLLLEGESIECYCRCQFEDVRIKWSLGRVALYCPCWSVLICRAAVEWSAASHCWMGVYHDTGISSNCFFTIRVLMPNYIESIECFIPLKSITPAVITWYTFVLMSGWRPYFCLEWDLGVVWEWREGFK